MLQKSRVSYAKGRGKADEQKIVTMGTALKTAAKRKATKKARVTLVIPISNADEEQEDDLLKHVTLTLPRMSLADPTDHAISDNQSVDTRLGNQRADATREGYRKTDASRADNRRVDPRADNHITNTEAKKQGSDGRPDRAKADRRSDKVKTVTTRLGESRMDVPSTVGTQAVTKPKPLRRSSASLTRVVRV